MRRYLCLLLCLPLVGTTACAADSITGPRLDPAPEADPVAQAAPNPAYQGCIVPPERVDRETLYIVDGVLLSSLPELAAIDIESVEVIKHLTETQTDPRARSVVIITTRSAARPRSGARP